MQIHQDIDNFVFVRSFLISYDITYKKIGKNNFKQQSSFVAALYDLVFPYYFYFP